MKNRTPYFMQHALYARAYKGKTCRILHLRRKYTDNQRLAENKHAPVAAPKARFLNLSWKIQGVLKNSDFASL